MRRLCESANQKAHLVTLAHAYLKVLINYPWDDCPGAKEGEKAPCPDDDVFKCLASHYADNHPFMWTG